MTELFWTETAYPAKHGSTVAQSSSSFKLGRPAVLCRRSRLFRKKSPRDGSSCLRVLRFWGKWPAVFCGLMARRDASAPSGFQGMALDDLGFPPAVSWMAALHCGRFFPKMVFDGEGAMKI